MIGAALLKVNPGTGVILKTASYQRGATEIMIDLQGVLRLGWRAGDGISLFGAYDRFSDDLEHLGGDNLGTSGRPSLLPDGASTVRLGPSVADHGVLRASGASTWEPRTGIGREIMDTS